ncbi:MAG: restriction endonuclease subunit R [Alphaproteobacteria bacterium CG_4_10_14_0_8_um_filter_53_9]|nr:MAG: restriction endonuclease subunit R [Alphaproteobacteria bacterium CG_4_10_14_0_8_um_filter_53_9]
MELKDYQRRVLERFGDYLQILGREYRDALDYYEFQKSKGNQPKLHDYPQQAWKAMQDLGTLPRLKTKHGLVVAEHVGRYGSNTQSFPHICLKVPTGGGKTLLAAECVGRLQTDLFKRQVGLVIWIVPTKQIYTQTRKALFNREHPYRQSLERASGGRVKVFEKDDPIHKADVENYLCIMLVRLAAANRQSSTEFLKIFRDSGKYASFFPEVDAPLANQAFLELYPDLQTNDLSDTPINQGLSIKHSLLNVLKIIRPIVVVDEGHKAYSDNTRESLNNFNPSFILELTATPNAKAHISNVLVDVSGVDLKDEQMIKLPINIFNKSNDDWKSTLLRASTQRQELENAALQLQADDNRYVRPIMVIRVERTGKDQRDGIKVHAEDAREYLKNSLNIPDEWIRVKSSENDELGSDDLLDPLCQVRFIITKEALQEGWDCPFAYVLALLDKTTASTAMTQMVGRVLRQPDTRTTSIDALNQCYIYCFNQSVQEAVDNVRKGLEEEGMTGLADFVREGDKDNDTSGDMPQLTKIRRREKFKELQIFLPKVLHQDGNGWRDIRYEEDIPTHVPWHTLRFDLTGFVLGQADSELSHTTVNVERKTDLFGTQQELALFNSTIKIGDALPKRLDVGFLAQQLMEVIPNPWQATRIMLEAIETLKAKHSEEQIFMNRLGLLDTIKRQMKAAVHQASEAVFRQKLADGMISFSLITSGDKNLNFALAHELEVLARAKEKVLVQDSGLPVENSLFDVVYEKDLNGLEKSMALYLAESQAITWWHRMVAKQEYALQGWQRNRIFPDFVACVNGSRILVLETKGLHLKGSDDTEYKKRLMDLLSEHYTKTGHMMLVDGQAQQMSLNMLMSDSWENEMNRLSH